MNSWEAKFKEALFIKPGRYGNASTWEVGGVSMIGNVTIIMDENDAERIVASEKLLALVRRMLWEEGQFGGKRRVEIPDGGLKELEKQTLPPFQQRMDDMLLAIKEHTKQFGSEVNIAAFNHDEIKDWLPSPSAAEVYAASGAQDRYEYHYFLEYLADRKFIKKSGMREATILADGTIYLETKVIQRSQSDQAFVAMWFPDVENSPTEYHQMKEADEVIQKAVRAAGYKPYRVDRDHHLNRIDDHIMTQIRRSSFLIADFTCPEGKPRGGVYFEAGFAKGLGLPVIWLVHKDSLRDVHFDTRQYNHIVWTKPEELRTQLEERIVANMGQGPVLAHDPS